MGYPTGLKYFKKYNKNSFVYNSDAMEQNEKYNALIKTIGEEAIPVKFKIWYQVYTKLDTGQNWIFAFAINSDIIEHFPIHQLNGKNASEARSWLRNRGNCEVVKICEQIIK